MVKLKGTADALIRLAYCLPCDRVLSKIIHRQSAIQNQQGKTHKCIIRNNTRPQYKRRGSGFRRHEIINFRPTSTTDTLTIHVYKNLYPN